MNEKNLLGELKGLDVKKEEKGEGEGDGGAL